MANKILKTAIATNFSADIDKWAILALSGCWRSLLLGQLVGKKKSAGGGNVADNCLPIVRTSSGIWQCPEYYK
jgi:hypothetical protein